MEPLSVFAGLRLWHTPALSSGFKTSSHPPKLHYSPAFEPQGFGHLSFSPGLWDRQTNVVSVAVPPQGKTGSTPTSVSPLGWESGNLGPSPHCVSLGTSLAFSRPQLCHLKNGERGRSSSLPPTLVDVSLLICQTWGCVSIIPTRAYPI